MHAISVNASAASQTITVYDSLTQVAPVIAIIGPTAATIAAPTTLFYDCEFQTGISVTLAVAGDVTITFAQ